MVRQHKILCKIIGINKEVEKCKKIKKEVKKNLNKKIILKTIKNQILKEMIMIFIQDKRLMNCQQKKKEEDKANIILK